MIAPVGLGRTSVPRQVMASVPRSPLRSRTDGQGRLVNARAETPATTPPTSSGSGSGSGISGGSGNGGSGGNGGNNDDDDEEYLNKDQALAAAAAAGISLPADYLATASAAGIKRSALEAYMLLQRSFLAGWLARTVPWFRDRLVYDNRFLFKVGAEVVIDSACATFAEVRKRGDEFWDELEFYLSDLLVGLVLDVVLVGLLAPTAIMGRRRKAATTGLQKALDRVPSAVFEKGITGVREYSFGARAACVGVKFLEYSLAGMFCGLVGQGIANTAMMARRANSPDAEFTVDPPPLLKTALVWGLFMGASSNLRYQAVFGLERLVDGTIARRVPQIAYGTTVGIRFVNNVIGGENFIDMARFFGVQ
eukprot:jgi/Ulvmu1/8890/UM049_0072.1